MRVQTVALIYHETLIHSHAFTSTLNMLKFFMRVNERFFFLSLTSDGFSTTLILVWPELMIFDEI